MGAGIELLGLGAGTGAGAMVDKGTWLLDEGRGVALDIGADEFAKLPWGPPGMDLDMGRDMLDILDILDMLDTPAIPLDIPDDMALELGL